jgi:predicted nucleic acid-binding protein
MSALLLDSSVWLAARDSDDRFHAAAVSLIGSGADLAALDLTLYEVCNVATVRWRSAAEAERLAEIVLAATEGRFLRMDREMAAGASAIAHAEGLTVYDAAYVACARERGWDLVSGDLLDLVSRGLAVSPDAVP